MTGRALVFSDPRIIALLSERFVPITDNCSYTQTQQDAKGEFFRLIAEQGHYAGRTKPTATRQGLYACTAAGKLLDSVNTTNADRVLALLHSALEKWEREEQNAPPPEIVAEYEPDSRFYAQFPEGGTVIRQYVRDLPRADRADWDDSRMNYDHVWLTPDEVASFIPAGAKVGDSFPLPDVVARRLTRYHLVDTVRGESPRWRSEHVRKSEMTLTLEVVEGTDAHLRLDGAVLVAADPTGEENPFSGFKISMERGLDLRVTGSLTLDMADNRLEKFEVIAIGQRWGATVYNGRADDLGPAPIGFAFELAPPSSATPTQPQAALWNYFNP